MGTLTRRDILKSVAGAPLAAWAVMPELKLGPTTEGVKPGPATAGVKRAVLVSMLP